MKVSSVNMREKSSLLRFDASFHLSEGLQVKRMIKASPYKMLQIRDVTEKIFYGNRAKRVYVNSRKNGEPFLSSSDILQSDLENVKLASKKYTPNIDQMRLKRGWTLISRSGTIGNCAFSNQLHAQKLASEDVIRLVPNYILREGIIYAYLASKYGHSLLTQGTFGAVIQHIEPDFVGSIPIPKFPDSFQNEVDGLIQKSARLREEATVALKNAHSLIELAIAEQNNNKPSSMVSLSKIVSAHTMRFEANYYVSKNRLIYDLIMAMQHHVFLGDYMDSVFKPGIFKRNFVGRGGCPLFGCSDLMKANPKAIKFLSKKQVGMMPELQVKRNYILVSRAGTIGNVIYVDKHLNNAVVSEDLLRIVSSNDSKNHYLYAFLTSKYGKPLITMHTYGSVIPHIEVEHIKRIPIPILDSNVTLEINSLIQQNIEKIEYSRDSENKAISMVEQEIDKWNNKTN